MDYTNRSWYYFDSTTHLIEELRDHMQRLSPIVNGIMAETLSKDVRTNKKFQLSKRQFEDIMCAKQLVHEIMNDAEECSSFDYLPNVYPIIGHHCDQDHPILLDDNKIIELIKLYEEMGMALRKIICSCNDVDCCGGHGTSSICLRRRLSVARTSTTVTVPSIPGSSTTTFGDYEEPSETETAYGKSSTASHLTQLEEEEESPSTDADLEFDFEEDEEAEYEPELESIMESELERNASKSRSRIKKSEQDIKSGSKRPSTKSRSETGSKSDQSSLQSELEIEKEQSKLKQPSMKSRSQMVPQSQLEIEKEQSNLKQPSMKSRSQMVPHSELGIGKEQSNLKQPSLKSRSQMVPHSDLEMEKEQLKQQPSRSQIDVKSYPESKQKQNKQESDSDLLEDDSCEGIQIFIKMQCINPATGSLTEIGEPQCVCQTNPSCVQVTVGDDQKPLKVIKNQESNNEGLIYCINTDDDGCAEDIKILIRKCPDCQSGEANGLPVQQSRSISGKNIENSWTTRKEDDVSLNSGRSHASSNKKSKSSSKTHEDDADNDSIACDQNLASRTSVVNKSRLSIIDNGERSHEMDSSRRSSSKKSKSSWRTHEDVDNDSLCASPSRIGSAKKSKLSLTLETDDGERSNDMNSSRKSSAKRSRLSLTLDIEEPEEDNNGSKESVTSRKTSTSSVRKQKLSLTLTENDDVMDEVDERSHDTHSISSRQNSASNGTKTKLSLTLDREEGEDDEKSESLSGKRQKLSLTLNQNDDDILNEDDEKSHDTHSISSRKSSGNSGKKQKLSLTLDAEDIADIGKSKEIMSTMPAGSRTSNGKRGSSKISTNKSGIDEGQIEEINSIYAGSRQSRTSQDKSGKISLTLNGEEFDLESLQEANVLPSRSRQSRSNSREKTKLSLTLDKSDVGKSSVMVGKKGTSSRFEVSEPKAVMKHIPPLTRVKITSSMDIDVKKQNSRLRTNRFKHKNSQIVIALESMGVDNVLTASRPAKCCRKATLDEKQQVALPYSVSLKSLPLLTDDIKVINQSYEMSMKRIKNSTNLYAQGQNQTIYCMTLNGYQPNFNNLLFVPFIYLDYSDDDNEVSGTNARTTRNMKNKQYYGQFRFPKTNNLESGEKSGMFSSFYANLLSRSRFQSLKRNLARKSQENDSTFQKILRRIDSIGGYAKKYQHSTKRCNSKLNNNILSVKYRLRSKYNSSIINQNGIKYMLRLTQENLDNFTSCQLIEKVVPAKPKQRKPRSLFFKCHVSKEATTSNEMAYPCDVGLPIIRCLLELLNEQSMNGTGDELNHNLACFESSCKPKTKTKVDNTFALPSKLFYKENIYQHQYITDYAKNNAFSDLKYYIYLESPQQNKPLIPPVYEIMYFLKKKKKNLVVTGTNTATLLQESVCVMTDATKRQITPTQTRQRITKVQNTQAISKTEVKNAETNTDIPLAEVGKIIREYSGHFKPNISGNDSSVVISELTGDDMQYLNVIKLQVSKPQAEVDKLIRENNAQLKPDISGTKSSEIISKLTYDDVQSLNIIKLQETKSQPVVDKIIRKKSCQFKPDICGKESTEIISKLTFDDMQYVIKTTETKQDAKKTKKQQDQNHQTLVGPTESDEVVTFLATFLEKATSFPQLTDDDKKNNDLINKKIMELLTAEPVLNKGSLSNFQFDENSLEEAFEEIEKEDEESISKNDGVPAISFNEKRNSIKYASPNPKPESSKPKTDYSKCKDSCPHGGKCKTHESSKKKCAKCMKSCPYGGKCTTGKLAMQTLTKKGGCSKSKYIQLEIEKRGNKIRSVEATTMNPCTMDICEMYRNKNLFPESSSKVAEAKNAKKTYGRVTLDSNENLEIIVDNRKLGVINNPVQKSKSKSMKRFFC